MLLDKKKTKGRYTTEVKNKVDALKIKITDLMPGFTENYQYTSKKERKFKTNEEIENILNPLPIKE